MTVLTTGIGKTGTGYSLGAHTDYDKLQATDQKVLGYTDPKFYFANELGIQGYISKLFLAKLIADD